MIFNYLIEQVTFLLFDNVISEQLVFKGIEH